MAKLDYLGLTNAPLEEVSLAGFEIINALQTKPPHQRAMAAAMVFLLLCKEFKTEPQDVFAATKNMMASDEEGANPHYAALQLYVQHEARQ